MKRLIPFVTLLIGSVLPTQAFTPTSDGLYAVFDTTMGEFTVRLLNGHSPVTCANFVGLAEGTLDWYDFEAQEVRSGMPFYDGQIFHRVVANFVIQAGSPNGQGNDGPGWRIPDEIHPDLKHIGGGVVSMANNGPNTGGSQFFITMAQFPETEAQLANLDGKHSIFGIIEEGHNITQDIGRVPTQAGRPAEGWETTINSITIVRQGVDANAWDPSLYWQAPVFSEDEVRTTFDLEDIDNDPNTAEVRALRAKWRRDVDPDYLFQDSNDLETWRTTFFPRASIPGQTREESRALTFDVAGDRRHFYQLVRADFPALPNLQGQRLTINFDPLEDTEDDFISYLPEILELNFYDTIIGKWQLKRSDSANLKPLGNIGLHQRFPLSYRSQIRAELDTFSSLQAYLEPNPGDPNTGSAYIYYPDGRPEGSTVTGTYTLSAAGEQPEPENKHLVELAITTVNEVANSDPITITYTIDLWDNATAEGFTDRYEAAYRIDRSDTEFIQTGRLLYEWLTVEGETNVILDFDFAQDMQVLLSDADSGTAEIFFRNIGQFDTGNFTLGVGNDRPVPTERNGDKIILTLDITQATGADNTSVIDIDFYDNGQGGYESTRTDSEANQFGDVIAYEWIVTDNETRLDLAFDAIPPMSVYLTPGPTGEVTATGDAKVHFVQAGAVSDATFEFIPGGGNPRPEPQERNGTQLQLFYNSEVLTVLTIDIFENLTGFFNTTRADTRAIPTGTVREYEWTTRSDGKDLVIFNFNGFDDIQVILEYDTGSTTSGTAEVLDLAGRGVNTVPFEINTAVAPPASINKAGSKLVIDIDTTLIDRIEVEFADSSFGTWERFRPSNATPDSGDLDDYTWQEYDGYDQVTILYDFLLDTQVFLNYTSPTSGTAIVYFITGRNFEEGTFTITNP